MSKEEAMFKDQATEKLYNERLNRYVTAMRRGTPDRIPIRFLYQEAAARYCGVTNQLVGCDYNAAFDVTRKMAEDMGNDAVMLNAIWSNYGVAKAASWRYLAVPGVDVGIESVNQFFEPEGEDDAFLRADEYDEFTEDPTAFLFNKWFSRATTRVRESGERVDFDHNLALISGALAYANYMNSFVPAAYKLKYEAGVVSANSGMIKAPLDIMADKFRGYINVCFDAHERRDKLLKACEALMPHILANALAGADPDKNVPITIWAHRGCVPFISREMFDEIFWPTLKPIFEEIIRQGHQILFYGEGNWEQHYDSLLELPAGGIIYHLDKGAPALAAKKLKPKFALSGGLSYDVLARGTPDDVRSHMKELFAVVKDGGGYILDATALMLSDIRPENIKAAVDYTMEHGVYSRSTPAKPAEKPDSAPGIPPASRQPHVCRPWEIESGNYKYLSGDVALVRAQWEKTDAAAYNYLWTTVLW
jgi:uroporphyrinogen-III decarboxylase